ncbi:hypothetical protein Ahy_B01g056110 isoform B [Arachis hypogaea]|uniref:Uncharacterized protein n=1 Tax=Arachis hypogaea TaxID=3818 RepID=A0A445AY10_ARAHY|nr:hypothetical protein Ahy_B01g056110 isoform B [Arachis hypogaea]
MIRGFVGRAFFSLHYTSPALSPPSSLGSQTSSSYSWHLAKALFRSFPPLTLSQIIHRHCLFSRKDRKWNHHHLNCQNKN